MFSSNSAEKQIGEMDNMLLAIQADGSVNFGLITIQQDIIKKLSKK